MRFVVHFTALSTAGVLADQLGSLVSRRKGASFVSHFLGSEVQGPSCSGGLRVSMRV